MSLNGITVFVTGSLSAYNVTGQTGKLKAVYTNVMTEQSSTLGLLTIMYTAYIYTVNK